jgi:glycerol uptake facilitator-like aquaporin
MNPTRSLAPGIVSGDRHATWLYIVASLLGASIGGLAYQFIRGESPDGGDTYTST